MSRWKRIGKPAAVVAGMLASFAVGATAADKAERVEAYLRHDFRVTLNGQQVSLKNPPLIHEGYSYLPVRAVSELLGVKVEWDETAATIRLIREPLANPTGQPAQPTPAPAPASPTPLPMLSDGRSLSELWASTPDEIKLSQVVKYHVTYRGRKVPWFAVVYRDTIFVRMEDAVASDIDVAGLKISKEKMTKNSYVSIELLKRHMTEQPTFELVPDRLIVGETDEAKIKTLRKEFTSPGQIVHEIRAVGDNTYMFLVEYPQSPEDSRWYGYKVELRSNGTDSWHVSKSTPPNCTATFRLLRRRPRKILGSARSPGASAPPGD